MSTNSSFAAKTRLSGPAGPGAARLRPRAWLHALACAVAASALLVGSWAFLEMLCDVCRALLELSRAAAAVGAQSVAELPRP